ncbi:MAG TPA: hypothetical protein VMY05_00710, partial [Acidobacteriota bacterium]|nr:hypothetical protein [Acidobacteriota bacterium]
MGTKESTMRRTWILLVLLLAVWMGGAEGQVTEVVLDHVTNSYDDTLLQAGAEHTFALRVRNIGSYVNYNPNNGFRVFSDDGAEWTLPYTDTVIDTTITMVQLPPDLILET